MGTPPTIDQVEFSESDFPIAHEIAKRLGYEQTAYTSTSGLWGLFCLPENPQYSKGPHTGGCIIKTKQFGFMFVADLEDLNMSSLAILMDDMDEEKTRSKLISDAAKATEVFTGDELEQYAEEQRSNPSDAIIAQRDELLELARQIALEDQNGNWPNGMEDILIQARAAIARAEGRVI